MYTAFRKIHKEKDAEPSEFDVSVAQLRLKAETNPTSKKMGFLLVGGHYIVDASSEEESQMSSAVTVSANRHGSICGMAKRGGAGLDPSILPDMISVAIRVSETFIAAGATQRLLLPRLLRMIMWSPLMNFA